MELERIISRARAKRWGGTWTRTAVYSASLLALLGYLTYRFVYANPSQVSGRVEDRLESFFPGAEVEPRNARWTWKRGTRVEELEVFTRRRSPVDLSVKLRELRVDPPGAPPLLRPGRRLRDRIGPAGGEGLERLPVRIDAAEVDAGGPEDLEGWFAALRSLLDATAIRRFLGEVRVEAAVERASVTLRPASGPEGVPAAARFRDLHLLTDPNGAVLEAELAPAEGWEHGDLEAWVSLAGEVVAWIEVGSIEAQGGWLALLPAALRAQWRALEPRGLLDGRGVVAVNVDSGEVLPPGPWPGPWSLDLEHRDTEIRLPGGVEAVHAGGGTRISPDGVSWGRAAGLQPFRAELLGAVCVIEGILREGGGELRIEVPRTPLRDIGRRGWPPWLRSASELVRPAGTLEGSVVLDAGGHGATGISFWNGDFDLLGISSASVPGLLLARATVRIDETEMRDDETRSAVEGRGELEIEKGLLRPFRMPLSGSGEISWEGGTLVLEARHLRPSGARSTAGAGTGAPAGAAGDQESEERAGEPLETGESARGEVAQAGERAGTGERAETTGGHPGAAAEEGADEARRAGASVRWEARAEGEWELDFQWSGLEVRSSLLEASSSRGRLTNASGREDGARGGEDDGEGAGEADRGADGRKGRKARDARGAGGRTNENAADDERQAAETSEKATPQEGGSREGGSEEGGSEEGGSDQQGESRESGAHAAGSEESGSQGSGSEEGGSGAPGSQGSGSEEGGSGEGGSQGPREPGSRKPRAQGGLRSDGIVGDTVLEEARVPSRVFGRALRFASGEATWRFSGHTFELLSLVLTSSRRSLRAAGRIDRGGEVDLAAIVVEGEGAAAGGALRASAPLAEWLEAAGEGATVWRVRGTLEAPDARRLTPDEFITLEALLPGGE